MSVETMAKELAEFCDMSDLKEQYFYLRERCKYYAAETKRDKYAIQYTEQNLKSDRYQLASNSFTINPKRILRNMAYRKSIVAEKTLLRRKKIDLKQDKSRYKEFVRQRDELVKRIKETHEEKKDEIQRGKAEKAREMGEKIRNIPSRAQNAVRDAINGKTQVVENFVRGLTGRQEDNDREER